MKICFLGIYDPQYPRNDVLLNALRSGGAHVVECREVAHDRLRYKKLIPKFSKLVTDCDVVIAAYPSPIPTLLAKIFSRKKVVADAFFSMYDAVVNDRREYTRFDPRALKLLLFDWLSALFADALLVDTEAHKKYWSTWPLINPHKIYVVPIGVNPKHVYKISDPLAVDDLPPHVSVTFHGNYIPLQGVTSIVRAFALLRDHSEITFRMVGWGQDFEKAMNLIQELGIQDRVDVIKRIPYEQINYYLNASDIILGIFGTSDKARRVVPNKVYEGCAVAKALITMDTPAIREMFTPEEIVLVSGTPESIAKAIRDLEAHPEKRELIAQRGYNRLVTSYTPQAMGHMLIGFLRQIMS